MKFSERLGYKPVREQLQIDSVDDELRNALWSVYLEVFLLAIPNSLYEPVFTRFARGLWYDFFKKPIDTLPTYSDSTVQHNYVQKFLRDFFFGTRNWYDFYDLIEFSVPFASHDFGSIINKLLDKEKSAYRLVNGQFVQITSKTEISAIEEAITSTDKYNSVTIHLNTALKYLADKENPDYRNSIKESISAVEAMCRIFTSNDKATLGDALAKLEKQNTLHPALKKSFSALYGYTSDESGIRHALIEGDRVTDFHEAKFLLVTCSSFINYLISRQK